ncbi:MAG: RNA polymerase sigma factor [Saprospiraceae bacterium]|nr:RNA polymerase sigma factor [Saprospiraceae bacterium]
MAGGISYHLLEGCRNRSRTAQEELYRMGYEDWMRMLRRYTRDMDEAADVLNRGMFKVFTKIDGFEGNGIQFEAWIRTILIREALDHIRSNKAASNHQPIEMAHEKGRVDPEDPAYILRLLERLPVTTATVFNLYALEGYSHKEIGNMLNISESNSKWHLFSARGKLQEWIRQTASL